MTELIKIRKELEHCINTERNKLYHLRKKALKHGANTTAFNITEDIQKLNNYIGNPGWLFIGDIAKDFQIAFHY